MPSPATHHATRPGRKVSRRSAYLTPESGGKAWMVMDSVFCAGWSCGDHNSPALFLPLTPLTFGVNWTPPPRQKARPPSRGTGFLPLPGILPGQNTPQQQQRKAASLPVFLALRSCFQPFPRRHLTAESRPLSPAAPPSPALLHCGFRRCSRLSKHALFQCVA